MSMTAFLLIILTLLGLVYQIVKKLRQMRRRQQIEFEGYCLLVKIKKADEQQEYPTGIFQQGEQEWEWQIPFSMQTLSTPVRGYVVVNQQKVSSFYQ